METKYPLEQLKAIKNKRFEQAMIIVEKKTEALKKEEEKMKTLEKERDEVLTHKKEKLQQLRQALDEGTTSDKLQQKKVYLKIVEEKLLEKIKKVEIQKQEVEKAKKALQEAKKDMLNKKKDLEKLQMHKKIWEKELDYYIKREEEKFEDEIGSVKAAIKQQKKER